MEIFAALSLFWIVMTIGAAIVISIGATELESWFLVALSAVLWFAFVPIVLGVSFLTAMFTLNPLLLLGLFIVYFLVGGLYVLLWAWPEWLEDRRDDIKMRFDLYKDVMIKRDRHDDSQSQLTVETFLESKTYSGQFWASNNKSMIVMHIIMWPFDMAWELLNRPIRWAYNSVYNLIINGLNHVTRNKIRKTLGE